MKARSHRQSLRFFDSIMMDQAELERFVILANRTALKFNKGEAGTCILTSFAVVYVLRDRGLNAHPLASRLPSIPTTANIRNNPRLSSISVGQEGEAGNVARAPRRRERRRMVIDPTIDQGDKPEWGAGIGMDPLVAQISPEFFDPLSRQEASVVWATGRQCKARYSVSPRQIGCA